MAGLAKRVGESIFEPSYWRRSGCLAAVDGGRGSAWFVGTETCDWVLRHYRRGGFAAKLSLDRYLWAGEARVRAFAEWRLLDALWRRGLPVAEPIAARYLRRGIAYRCDLITRRVADARPLSALLTSGQVAPWAAIGAAVAALHREGVDHADLNAHNVLIDDRGRISFIDFDRGRLRTPGGWSAANLQRLQRSLAKIGAATPTAALGRHWEAFMQGYRGTDDGRTTPQAS